LTVPAFQPSGESGLDQGNSSSIGFASSGTGFEQDPQLPSLDIVEEESKAIDYDFFEP
jgi:hypothetical protein